MPIPHELLNGPGSFPDADKYMANWHWVFAMAKGNFLKGPGFEQWDVPSHVNPANATSLCLGWTLEKAGTTPVDADINREATIVDAGGYSMKVSLNTTGSSDSHLHIAQTLDNPTRFAGQTVILGVKVRTATANKVRLSISDGISSAGSSYHTGDGTWQKLTVPLACSQSISSLTLRVEITSDFDSDDVYVDSAFVYAIEPAMSQAARDLLVYFRPDDPLTMLLNSLTLIGSLTAASASISGLMSAGSATITGSLAAPVLTDTFLGLGRNRVINGAMNFDQRLEGGVYTATDPETYTLDNMRVGNHSAGVLYAQQTTTAPPGFQKAIQFTVHTANASPAADDNVHLEIPLEGYSIKDFEMGTSGAKKLTVSFWAACSVVGEYTVSLMNGINTVSNVSSFTNPVNTWTFHTVTFDVCTIGAWDVTTGFGLKLLFDLGTGSDYATATTDQWVGQAKWRKTGTVSLIQNAGAVMYLSGIQLEKGETATPFEHIDPTIELLRCQRYYWKSFVRGQAVGTQKGYLGAITYVAPTASTTTGHSEMVRFPVQMAGTPTITFFNPTNNNAKWYAQNGATADSGTAASLMTSAEGFCAYNPQAAGDVAASVISVHAIAVASLGGS